MKKITSIIAPAITAALLLSACGGSAAVTTAETTAVETTTITAETTVEETTTAEVTTTTEETTTEETTTAIVNKDVTSELEGDQQLKTALSNIINPILVHGAYIFNDCEIFSCDDTDNWYKMLYNIYANYPQYYDYSIYPVDVADTSVYPSGALNAVYEESFQWIAENIYNTTPEQISDFTDAVINSSSNGLYLGDYTDGFYCVIGGFATEGYELDGITINSAIQNDDIYTVNATFDFHIYDNQPQSKTFDLTLNQNEADGVQYWAFMNISLAE